MNLRELCQAPGFDTAILTSFNFDPLFFERIILRDLLASGCRQILVFADGVQCLPGLEAARTQVFELGRKYQLFPVWQRGAFHPKLLVKLSDEGALVSCGSHNLTRPGWLGLRAHDAAGGNREVAIAWRMDANTGGAPQLVATLRTLRESTALPAARGALDHLLRTAWLLSPGESYSDRGLLMSGSAGTLATQLAGRWVGRRFDRIRVATGSTDTAGAFLAWAARTFGVREAIVELDPADASFDANVVGRLPLTVRIVPRPAPPRPHLKAVRFEGGDGAGLVVGSANCSAAAWLVPVQEGGNVEAVVVFDNPAAAVSDDLFDVVGETVGLADVVFAGVQGDRMFAEVAVPRILHAELRRRTGTLEVVMSESIGEPARVQLVLDDERRSEAYRIDALRWACEFGPLEYSPRTMFCHAVLLDTAQQSNRCWIDDTDELGSRRGAQLDFRPLEALAGAGRGHEPAQVLKGMTELAHYLLTHRPEEVAPLRTTAENAAPTTPAPRPLTLEQVVASFEHTLRPESARPFRMGTSDQSLHGVLRAIFLGTEHGVSASAAPDAISEEGRVAVSAKEPTPENEPEPPQEGQPPSDKQRQRLIRQIARFVDQVATDEFAESATARHLQQSIAFPLGCSLLAARGEWIGSATDRSEWGHLVRRTCNALLTPRQSKCAGSSASATLMDRVRRRYEQAERAAEFDRVVGDGALWLTLLAAITRADFGPGSFDRTLLLDEVARADSLRVAMSPDQLTELTRLLAIQEDAEVWASQTIDAVGTMTALRQHLQDDFEALRIASRGRGAAGDWLWRPQIGFARIEQVDDSARARLYAPSRGTELHNVQLSFYANLRVLGLLK